MVKTIPKKSLSKAQFANELKAHQDAKRNNVQKALHFIEAFRDNRNFYLVFERHDDRENDDNEDIVFGEVMRQKMSQQKALKNRLRAKEAERHFGQELSKL